MNISFVASEKFLPGAKVMLVSFLVNNDFEEHNIYWLYTDISKEVIQEFCSFFKNKFNQVITPFQMTKDMMKGFDTDSVFGPAAFHKLFIFNYLSIPGGRILSLDADAIVNGSLKEFYYQDMNNACIAASQDLYIRYTDNDYVEGFLNIPNGQTYVNLGNSLFNVDLFRQAFSIEEYADYIRFNPDKIRFVSQDIVNVLLYNQIKVCDAFRYNLQIYSGMNLFIGKANIKKICSVELAKKIRKSTKEQPVIVHYVRQKKPWAYDYLFGYKRFYKKYARKTFGMLRMLKTDFVGLCWLTKKIVLKLFKINKA